MLVSIEFLTKITGKRELHKFAEKTIVEQHKDELHRAHIYFYSPILFPQKSADSILGIEIKSRGDHGIMFVSPSVHKNGFNYEIIGSAKEPLHLCSQQAIELMRHIDNVCSRYGLKYLEKEENKILTERLKKIIKILQLEQEFQYIINEGQRHMTMLSLADSLLIHHKNKLQKISSSFPSNLSLKSKSKLFFTITKDMYPAGLGIEILCIMAAEIGENIGLYKFGFNLFGITLAYIIGYTLAGFTTFMTILGRYSSYSSTNSNNIKIESCCSILDQQSQKGFLTNMLLTFKSFINGFRKISNLRRQSNLKYLLKTSLIILITAESTCILTAETIGIVFYNYSIVMTIPLALLGEP